MFWLLKALFYLLRRLVFTFYQVLVFISKPGARWLVPLVVIGLAGWQAETVLQLVASPQVMGVLENWIPLPTEETELYAIITLLAFIVVFVILSLVLRSFLGAFPPLRKPLPPQRALRVRNPIKRPASVSLAVPRLKHRFKHSQQDRWVKRLPPAVQVVLQTSQTPSDALRSVLTPPSPSALPNAQGGPVATPEPSPAPEPRPTLPDAAPAAPGSPLPPRKVRKPESTSDDWKKRVPPRSRNQDDAPPKPTKALRDEVSNEPEP